LIGAQGTAFDGAAAFTIKIAGAKSTKKFTLASATAVPNAITQINASKSVTGVFQGDPGYGRHVRPSPPVTKMVHSEWLRRRSLSKRSPEAAVR
jgi:hypothetical protein